MLILTLPRYSCFELYASRGNTHFISWYRHWPLCHWAAFAVTGEDPGPFDKTSMSSPIVITFNGTLTRLPWPWSSPLVDDVGWLLIDCGLLSAWNTGFPGSTDNWRGLIRHGHVALALPSPAHGRERHIGYRSRAYNEKAWVNFRPKYNIYSTCKLMNCSVLIHCKNIK